jgi:hypothetical protein
MYSVYHIKLLKIVKIIIIITIKMSQNTISILLEHNL